MDDGNAKKRKNKTEGFNLNTQSFTLEENILLTKILLDRYGLVCSVEKNNGYHRIYVFLQSVSHFRNIINEFVVPSMRYKLG
ncbi:MAG: endonuclease family [Candidatus Parcubacteria bacterium]|jgi:hypothetical protein